MVKYIHNIQVTILTILSVLFNGIKRICNVVQPLITTIHFQNFSSSQRETLYQLNSKSLFSLLSAADNLYAISCLYEFAYSRYLMYVELYNICLFLSAYFTQHVFRYLSIYIHSFIFFFKIFVVLQLIYNVVLLSMYSSVNQLYIYSLSAFLRFIYVAYIRISLLKVEQYSTDYIYHTLVIHSSADRYWSSIHFNIF